MKGRSRKGQRRRNQETDSSKLIVSDNCRDDLQKKDSPRKTFPVPSARRRDADSDGEKEGGKKADPEKGIENAMEGNCKKEGDKDGACDKFSRPVRVKTLVATSRQGG